MQEAEKPKMIVSSLENILITKTQTDNILGASQQDSKVLEN